MDCEFLATDNIIVPSVLYKDIKLKVFASLRKKNLQDIFVTPPQIARLAVATLHVVHDCDINILTPN
jgi:hypothetical protein